MKTADCRKNGCLELRTFTNEQERTETVCILTGRIPGNCNCPKESAEKAQKKAKVLGVPGQGVLE